MLYSYHVHTISTGFDEEMLNISQLKMIYCTFPQFIHISYIFKNKRVYLKLTRRILVSSQILNIKWRMLGFAPNLHISPSLSTNPRNAVHTLRINDFGWPPSKGAKSAQSCVGRCTLQLDFGWPMHQILPSRPFSRVCVS